MEVENELKQNETLIILHESTKRMIFYRMYFRISMLKMWMNSVYRPNMPMDITHAGTAARSVLKSAKELEQIAQEFIDILESEKINEQ